MRDYFVITAFFSFLLSFGCLYADIVHLKNGKALEGEILEKDESKVVIRAKLGEITLNSSDIDSVEEKALPDDFFEVKQTPKPKESQKANPVEAKKDKEKKPEKPLYSIDLKAAYRTSSSNEYVDVDGTTNLPDNALIFIFFKRLENYIMTAKSIVNNGSFSMTFGPLQGKVPGGTYTIEADFMPDKQTEDVIRKLKGDKNKLVHGSCFLTFGDPEAAQINEKQLKVNIKSMACELKALYDELDKTYTANKVSFDGNTWNKWSQDWLSRVRKVKSNIALLSQKGLSLFPISERRLSAAVNTLFNLHTEYSTALKNPSGTKSPNPLGMSGTDMLKMSFSQDMEGISRETGSGE